MIDQMGVPLYRENSPWTAVGGGNAGLFYNKFFDRWGSDFTKIPEGAKATWIERALPGPIGDAELLKERAGRTNALVQRFGSDGAVCFDARTDWRFVTGIGLSHPVDNGFAWHYTLGVPYLPGSSIKGLVGEWARRHLGAAQATQALGTPESAGCVIFLDALPVAPLQLSADVLTPHQGPYYQGGAAPGDWHNPIPAPFLTVAPGQAFRFVVLAAGRHGDCHPSLCSDAAAWLKDALSELGAGAKSAAGYGRFTVKDENREHSPSRIETTFSTSLELVTPAFLRGASRSDANSEVSDCDLRAPTLRGHLRWWWRTMHAAHLDIGTLLALESAIWGDTNGRSAVTIRLRAAASNPSATLFSKQAQGAGLIQMPSSDRLKRTQGLFYLSYGMDEPAGRGPDRRRKQRAFLTSGARWQLEIRGRATPGPDSGRRQRTSIPAEMVLGQVLAALWLFSRYGGIGSKARKGFGSIADMDVRGVSSLADCRQAGATLRSYCGLPVLAPERTAAADGTPTLEGVRATDIGLAAPNPWLALDILGWAAQDFAKQKHHDPQKEALGLPRKIHGPLADRPIAGIQDPSTWQPPVWLGSGHPRRNGRRPQDMRHAAPVHYHLSRAPNGNGFVLRVTGFPSPILPDLDTSRRVIDELLQHLTSTIPSWAARLPKQTGTSIGAGSGAPQRRLPENGTLVEATLVAEKTSKGGWRARYEPTGFTGPILNSQDVPAECKPGDVVRLVVRSSADFKLPSPSDLQPKMSNSSHRRPDGRPSRPPQRPRR